MSSFSLEDVDLLDKACAYFVGEFKNRDRVKIERRDFQGDTWAISDGMTVLNKSGEWEYEPSPSFRDAEFLQRCRFTLQEALVAVGWRDK